MLAFVALFALQGFAQEHFTEGPVWSVTTIRVKPAHFDDYLTALRQNIKPFWDEAKREGVVMDWKVFVKQTRNGPQDWDIALAVLYKNHAQMDGQAAKFEAIRDKMLGGKKRGPASRREAGRDSRGPHHRSRPGNHVEVTAGSAPSATAHGGPFSYFWDFTDQLESYWTTHRSWLSGIGGTSYPLLP